MDVYGFCGYRSMIVNGSARFDAMDAQADPSLERERGVCSVCPRRLRPERVEQLTDILKALADPTRVEIVAILRSAEQPVCICDLTAAFDLTQPTLSHHMAKLRDAGLVDVEKRG